MLGYQVFQKLDLFSNESFTVYDGQDSTARSTVIKELVRNSVYAFTVVALNAASFCVNLDAQALSQPLEVATLASSILGGPASIFVISRTGGSLTIGWTPPEDLAGAPLLGYHVALVSQDDGSTAPLGDLPVPNSSFTHYGLTEKTNYMYVVYARNVDGLGDPSTALTATTGPASKPSAVQNIRTLEVTGGEITLTWDLPLDTGGRDIAYYTVNRSERESDFTTTTAVFEDFYELFALKIYTYEVRAFNGLSLGLGASFEAQTTAATKSMALLFTSAVAFGGKFEVAWQEPEDIGGASDFEFLIVLQDQNRIQLAVSNQSADTSYTFSGLNASSQYYLVGKVITFAGESDPVEYVVETTEPDQPSAPPPPNVTAIRGGSVMVTVTGPAYDGGESVTLALFSGAKRVHDFASQETTWTVYGLTADTQYAFSVSASNSAGEIRGRPRSVTTGSISTPGDVLNVVNVDLSYDQLDVAWDPVVDTGGDLGLQYQVTYFKSDASGVQLNVSDGPVTKLTSETHILLESLDYSSFYSIVVNALTTTGLIGNSSVAQVFETEAPNPGRVVVKDPQVTVSEGAGFVTVFLKRIEGSFGDAEFSFTTQDDSAVAGENYEFTEGTLTLATNVDGGNFTVPIIDDGLYKPNTTFTVVVTDSYSTLSTAAQVVIVDNGDAGFLSFTSDAFAFLENAGEVTLPITRVGGLTPSATITAFIASERTAIAATLGPRFTLPEPTLVFGENVTTMNLRVQITNDNEYQFYDDSANLSFTITGGPLYGAHQFTNVTAVDDGDVSPPKEPVALHLLAVSGGYMRLQWTPPLDRGGENVVLSYQVDFKHSGVLALTAPATTTNETIYGLNASTTYEVTVRALNSAAGSGQPSKISLLTTALATRASAPQQLALVSAASSSLLLSWDPPVDDGGSRIVSYKIYSVLPTGFLLLFPYTSCVVPTMCSVKGLTALTNYTMQVRASTFLASDGELTAPLLVQTSTPDIPDPPPVPLITSVTAGAISVMMQDPFNAGGSVIETYRLFLMEDGELEYTLVYEGISRNHTVYRLKHSTLYQVRSEVRNLVGPSGSSVARSVTTEQRSLVSAPLNVTVVNITGGAIRLAWEEPLDIGGRDITGYTIMIKTSNPADSDIVGYDGKRDNAREGTVYSLSASLMYNLYVLAVTEVSNCFQPSDWAQSETVSVTTLPPMNPGTAPQLVLSRFTGGIIEVTWTEPKDTGGVPITDYVLYSVSAAGELRPLFTPRAANVFTYIHRDLAESTTYSYLVIANNSVGESPPSDALTQKTLSASPPSAPLNVQQLGYKTGGAVEIGWERPIDTGGQPLKGYLIYRDGAVLSVDLNASTVSYVDKSGLSAAKSYEYTLRAFSTSSLGSEFSAICTATTTSATKSQRPLIVETVAASSSIKATWAADPDTGGLPIKLFDVQLLLNSTVVAKTFGLITAFTFRGLVASSTYTLSVVSYNDMGASPTLLANVTTPVITLPAAPIAPLAVSIFGGNFTIELTAPVDNGGASITSMTVFETRLGTLATLKLSPGVASIQYTIYGVERESDYSVSCSATNVLGESPISPSTAIRTAPVNAPGMILSPPVFIVATGTSLTASWGMPIDTGGDLNMAFELRVLNPANPTLAPLIFPSVTRQVTATKLDYNTLYAVSVRATNKIGPGLYSPAASLRTQPDAAGEFNLVNASASIYENVSTLSLLILRTNGLSGRVALLYQAVPVSASPATVGSDFELAPGPTSAISTMYFDNLQVAGNLTVHIINDPLYEYPDEQFEIQLISASVVGSSAVAKIGASSVTRVTILDDGDAGYIGFDKPAYNVSEGGQTAVLPIIREGGSSGRVTLTFTFGPGTATVDKHYRRVPGNMILEDGVTHAELRVPIINDRVFEFPDEFLFIQIQVVSGGAILRQSSTQLTILDDGDVSVPGYSFPPHILAITGGAVTLALELPAHNGSAKGLLTGYTVRLTNAANVTTELNIPPKSSVLLGNLTALTTYQVSVAASNLIGTGAYSDPMALMTGEVSIPGPVTYVEMREKRGGHVRLYWYAPDDTGGVPITKYRVHLVDPTGLPQVVATNTDPIQEATVYGLNATTPYSFAVQAGNLALVPVFAGGWGAVSALFNFSTGDPTIPGPTDVYADIRITKKPTGGSIPLRWDPPKDTGGIPITGYNVYGRSATTPFLLLRSGENSTALSGVASTLKANSWYQFFVLPRNSVPLTNVLGNISIISSAKVAQTTSDLSKLLSTGAVLQIIGSDVFVVVGNMSKATKSVIPLFTNHTGTSLTSRKARLVGQAFSFVNASTLTNNIPDTPPVPTLLRATGGLFELVLYSPDDTGGIQILDFNVYLNDELLDDTNLVKVSTTVVSGLKLTMNASISDLEPLTAYTIQVVAVNSYSSCFFGQVKVSDAVNFTTTSVSAPDAPKIAPLRETGAGITMSIIDPKDKGGYPITRYQLYFRPNSSSSNDSWALGYSGALHQAQVAQLKPTTFYVFKVSVFNGYLESANSTEFLKRTTPPSPPGPCAEPTLTSATGGMLNVSWQLPLDDGGAAVTKFMVTLTVDADGSGRDVRIVTDLYYAFYGLQPQTDYRVVVQASNIKGAGPESDPKVVTTTDGSPPVGPIDVRVLQTTGGAAVVAFNAPVDLGGANPADMVYQVFIDRKYTLALKYADLEAAIIKSAATTTAASTSTSSTPRRLSEVPSDGNHRRLAASPSFAGVVIGGLDPEELYNIQLKPLSGFGLGRSTVPTPVVTSVATVSSKPLNLAAGLVTGGLVVMVWDPPADTGGTPLDEYDLYLSIASNTGPFLKICSDVVTKCRVDQLAPGTDYWFYVLVRNDVGDSPPSATVGVTTIGITPPSSPQNVRIVMVALDSVDCTWDAPEDFGGNDIASYNIAVTSLDGTQTVTASQLITIANVGTLAPSTTYSIVLVRRISMAAWISGLLLSWSH